MMNILGNNNILYIYANEEHMLEGMRGYETRKMQFAQYALKMSEDLKLCNIIKDRTATFNAENTHSTKKMLKMIKIMLDDD